MEKNELFMLADTLANKIKELEDAPSKEKMKLLCDEAQLVRHGLVELENEIKYGEPLLINAWHTLTALDDKIFIDCWLGKDDEGAKEQCHQYRGCMPDATFLARIGSKPSLTSHPF